MSTRARSAMEPPLATGRLIPSARVGQSEHRPHNPLMPRPLGDQTDALVEPRSSSVASAQSATSVGLGHDFGQVSVFPTSISPGAAPAGHSSLLRDQTSGSGGGPASAPTTAPTPTATPATPTVDRIDIVDSPSGAIGGYPPVTTGDLNTPGPWNSTSTDGVSNVHQIQFHLDQGSSADLVPTRQLQRSAWIGGVEHRNPADLVLPGGLVIPGGFNGVLVGPDGPAAHEVQRPASDSIVVADAPGIAALSSSSFPFIYRSHFTVTVATTGGTPVARTGFDVRIEKRSAADVPNTENRIFSTSKEDLVRNRSLP